METKHWIMLGVGAAAVAAGYWWWKNHQVVTVNKPATIPSSPSSPGIALPPPDTAPPMSVPSDQPWIDPITAAANQARADKAAQERMAQASSFASPAFLRSPGT